MPRAAVDGQPLLPSRQWIFTGKWWLQTVTAAANRLVVAQTAVDLKQCTGLCCAGG
jgi:P2-related tail formation protein